MTNTVTVPCDELQKLKDKLEIAIEALKFYSCMRHPVYQDTAKKALAKIKEVDNG